MAGHSVAQPGAHHLRSPAGETAQDPAPAGCPHRCGLWGGHTTAHTTLRARRSVNRSGGPLRSSGNCAMPLRNRPSRCASTAHGRTRSQARPQRCAVPVHHLRDPPYACVVPRPRGRRPFRPVPSRWWSLSGSGAGSIRSAGSSRGERPLGSVVLVAAGPAARRRRVVLIGGASHARVETGATGRVSRRFPLMTRDGVG